MKLICYRLQYPGSIFPFLISYRPFIVWICIGRYRVIFFVSQQKIKSIKTTIMKKNYFLLAVIMTALSFVSCRKENVSAPDNAATPVEPNERPLLTYKSNYSDITFMYNADKTIKNYTWANGTAQAEFTYPPNKLYKVISSNGVKEVDYVYELSGGIAQKMTATVYNPNGIVIYTGTFKYFYNANKQLVKYEIAKNGILMEWVERSYNADGDMVFSVTKNANGVIIRTATYEYDHSILDKAGSYGQSESNGAGSVLPKLSKYMIKRQTTVENNTTTILHYSYTTDAMGYVITGQIKNDQNVILDTWTQTWQ